MSLNKKDLGREGDLRVGCREYSFVTGPHESDTCYSTGLFKGSLK